MESVKSFLSLTLSVLYERASGHTKLIVNLIDGIEKSPSGMQAFVAPSGNGTQNGNDAAKSNAFTQHYPRKNEAELRHQLLNSVGGIFRVQAV
jgi:hypothetical protein